MRRLILAFGLVSALACGSDTTEPVANASGTWNLATVNGAALPFTLIANEPVLVVEIVSDQIIAYGDGTFVGTTTYRQTESGTVTTVTQVPDGTWNQRGTSVTIHYSDGSTARATISGDVITVTAPGVVAVYERE